MTVQLMVDGEPRQVAGEPAAMPEHLVIQQFYLGCLSLASYIVGDRRSGRAAVIDPPRDIDVLLEAAAREGLRIEWVLETHFHADFLSGHLEMAAATGARIGLGARGTTEFESTGLVDHQLVDLGGVQLEVLETPGHTPESVCFLVLPEPGAPPVAVLTGDTLFIGDVGRPDLLASVGVSANELGSMLYRSIHRLLGLADDVLVLPAHGAGSACGRSLSSETVSTIGEQRRTNDALQPMSEERFISMVTEGLPTAPGYFAYDAVLNRSLRPLLDEQPPAPLTLDEVDAVVSAGGVVLDTRAPEVFAGGHLRGSINVGLGGRFGELAGSVIPADTPVVLVGEPGSGTEAKVRLGRIGFDRVVGELREIQRVLSDSPARASRASRLDAHALDGRIAEGAGVQLVDVRNPGEIAAAPIPRAGVLPIPLAGLPRRVDELDPSRPVVVVCAGGFRSSIAASVLRRAGFTDVSDVLGGAGALGAVTACAIAASDDPASEPGA